MAHLIQQTGPARRGTIRRWASESVIPGCAACSGAPFARFRRDLLTGRPSRMMTTATMSTRDQ